MRGRLGSNTRNTEWSWYSNTVFIVISRFVLGKLSTLIHNHTRVCHQNSACPPSHILQKSQKLKYLHGGGQGLDGGEWGPPPPPPPSYWETVLNVNGACLIRSHNHNADGETMTQKSNTECHTPPDMTPIPTEPEKKVVAEQKTSGNVPSKPSKPSEDQQKYDVKKWWERRHQKSKVDHHDTRKDRSRNEFW